jgi:replication factor C large subunit|tara:strand:- start:370 stop:1554 length:1185 start_codon:yes stop_codon:yes gene_type:complete
MTWTERYRPKSFLEIKGQDEAIRKIKNFIEGFHLGKLTRTSKKALIFHGGPGTGKTTLVHVTAKETDSEIFELNASDLRNKNKLHEILKPAIEQKSLIKKGKIILVDEVDGISAVDRGGLTELLSLITISPYPIIITANDIWNKKLSPLRKKSEIIKLNEIDFRIIKEVLINILRKENKFLNENILTEISIRSKGDLRAAINDLQRESSVNSEVFLDERNKEKDIFNALKEIFKKRPSKETLEIFNSVKMSIDEIILWVEKNIPAEYQGEELARAFDLLSKADIFKGRIYKQQYWRFLVYENIFLSYGISASKKNEKIGFTSYQKPDRILKIWLNNRRIEKKKSISQKYAKYVHIGEKRAINEFPMFVSILRKPSVQKELKLNEDEIEYLNKIV